MAFTFPHISNLNINHKRVFLRADLNVPLENAKILQDYRLKKILPSIDYIQKHGGKVILATHLGRPKLLKNTHICDESVSTKQLLAWFIHHGYKIEHESDLKKAALKSHEDFHSILLLENLRCFAGEQQQSLEFAQLLAQTADLYINDAFGVMHRNDTSVTLLAKQFRRQDRAFGLLVEQEITSLITLKEQPLQPFIMVLGGSKINDKMPLLEQFFSQPPHHRIKKVLVGGVLANGFLQAKGISIGADTVDHETLNQAQKILTLAKEKNIEIILPLDRYCTSPTCDSSAHLFVIEKIPNDLVAVDIGPKTIDVFSKEIAQAKTIFANGTMGIYEKSIYALGSKKILEAIATSGANTIIGGGDAVGATYLFGLDKKMKFLSTGGGATLEFLGTKKPQLLPAIAAINE